MNIIPVKVLPVFALSAGLLFQPLSAQDTTTDPPAPAKSPTISTLERITDSATLRVGVNPEFIPFSFIGDNGKRVGTDIDIATKLAEMLGVELKVTAPDAFGDLIPMLKADEIDAIIAGMSINFARAREVNFSDPYFDTGVSILMNIGNSTRLGIGNLKNSGDLLDTLNKNGKQGRLKIAVTEGKAPQQLAGSLFPDATVTGYATNAEAIEATLNGETNLMIHDEIYLKVWLKNNEDRARFRLRVLDPPIKPDAYGIAVRKGDWEWLQLVNEYVRELRVDNQVVQYLAEYLPSMRQDLMSSKATLKFDSESMDD